MTEDLPCFDKVEIDAHRGDAEAQFYFGAILVTGMGEQGKRQEIHWYPKSTNHGDYAKAQVIPGYTFDPYSVDPYSFNPSIVIRQDYKKAVYWYTKSAKQGYAPAQYNLGHMYYNGAGVGQDSKQAAYWWKKAALLDHAAAQYNLGLMYHNGDGVLQDDKQAVYWYTKSADQGYAPALDNLRRLIGPSQ